MAVAAEVTLRGNPEGRFEDIYAACQPRIFRTCLAILRNADDAAEATQEVFSRALPLLTELREPQVWLQTVARNYCLDQLRRQKVRGLGTTLDEETPGSRRDDPEREALLRDALRQAFQALSPRERRALARVLLMDDSLADIAAMLGVSYSAAAQVVSRARRRAALAARAVIGASLGWLARLSVSRGRERAGRMVAQLGDTGQQVLIAAVVIFSAGSLARPVEAVAPAHTDGTPMAPRLVAPAASGGQDVIANVSAGGVAHVAVSVPRPQLPAGYPQQLDSVCVLCGQTGTHEGSTPQPTPTPTPALTVTPPAMHDGCVTTGAGVSGGGLPATYQPVQACQP